MGDDRRRDDTACAKCHSPLPDGAAFCPECGEGTAGPELPGYTVLRTLGQGGSAIVHLARQHSLDRLVAIKVLRQGVDRADEWRRFRREAHTIARLSGHPNVVTIYTTGRAEAGHPFLVTEYLDRGSLADVIADDGPLPPVVVASIGVAVADALVAGHALGILHRDVKPGNVLLGHDGRVKLGDFGIARLTDPTATVTDVVAFTPEHVAPELLRGERDGPPGDVYGLGSTLATALAGSSPFVRGPEERMDAFLARKVMSRPPELPPTVPADLAGAIAAALDPDPAARPGLAELRALLQRAADGPATAAALAPPTQTAVAPSPAPTAMLPTTERRAAPLLTGPIRRRRGTAVAVATAAAVVAAGAIAVVAMAGDDDGEPSANPTTTTTATTAAPVVTADAAVAPVPTQPAVTAAPPSTPAPTEPTAAAPPVTAGTTSAPTTSPSTTTVAPAAPEVDAPPPATDPPPPEPTQPVSLATQREVDGFVRGYYDLVAVGDYDRSWAQLTPEFQRGTAQSYDYYVDFWNDNDIEVRDVELIESRSEVAVVRVELRWNDDDRSVVNELTLRRNDDGDLLIVSQEDVD